MKRRNLLLAALAAPLAFFSKPKPQAAAVAYTMPGVKSVPARHLQIAPGNVTTKQLERLEMVSRLNAKMRAMLATDDPALTEAIKEYVAVYAKEENIQLPALCPWYPEQAEMNFLFSAHGVPVYSEDFGDMDSIKDYREIFRDRLRAAPRAPERGYHPVFLVNRLYGGPGPGSAAITLRDGAQTCHVKLEPCLVERKAGYVCELVYLDGIRIEKDIDEIRNHHFLVDAEPVAWVRNEDEFQVVFDDYTNRMFKYEVAAMLNHRRKIQA